MKIELQYFDGCPSWKTARDRLEAVLGDLEIDTEIHLEPIETPEAAESAGFRGSPTILIDGMDPWAVAGAPVSLSCRVYVTADGPAGSPTRDELATAIAGAQ